MILKKPDYRKGSAARNRPLGKLSPSFLALLLLVTSCTKTPGSPEPIASTPVTVTEAGTWAFTPEPDTYNNQALLDLRFLNEKIAGESGFIRRSPDGRNFVKGDGVPIRFWAVNSDIWREGKEAIADQARFLAKRGVNLVRWHGQIEPKNEDSNLTDIDEKARDQLWQFVAGMKQEGIYMTISPYYAMPVKAKPNWGIPRDSESMQGLLFFDPELQAAYKGWLRSLFEPVNPYTGIPLKDDPAVAIIQLQNEDSLLFWTVESIQGRDREILSGQFGEWLKKKYGSLAVASKAWNNTKLETDDFNNGRVGFYHIWEMTQEQKPNSGKAKRLADQTQFWTETMHNFNQEMVRFLREEIGAKQLINAGNWKTANSLTLNDAERYSYTPSEVMGVNRYYDGGGHWGEFSGWAIVNGDKFINRSVLFDPSSLPTNLKQVAGYPMIIPESSWVPPLGYQSEAPFLVSIYQSLGGVDAFYWFSMKEPQWRQPSSANGFKPSIGKWVINTPELLGNFPAAALMYRQNYIQPGSVVVAEKRSLDDLWQRRSPIIGENSGFDPNRDQEAARENSENRGSENSVHPLAFLVGPVEVTYNADPAQSQAMNLDRYIDEKAKVVRSQTGEIQWDYGKGIATLNAPKAQGVTGFLGQIGKFELGDITIVSGNNYATAIAVSMDDQPIATSKKILIQVGTVARPHGWTEKAVNWEDKNGQQFQGFEVVSYGEAPWAIAENNLTITVNNPKITKATVLDMNGLARGQAELHRQGNKVTVQMPPDAKYLILQ
jgi:hypothetical protein